MVLRYTLNCLQSQNLENPVAGNMKGGNVLVEVFVISCILSRYQGNFVVNYTGDAVVVQVLEVEHLVDPWYYVEDRVHFHRHHRIDVRNRDHQGIDVEGLEAGVTRLFHRVL